MRTRRRSTLLGGGSQRLSRTLRLDSYPSVLPPPHVLQQQHQQQHDSPLLDTAEDVRLSLRLLRSGFM